MVVAGLGDSGERRVVVDEIREFIEEEHWRISVKIVSNRFTLSRTSSRKAIRLLRLRPLVIRTVPHLEDRHIRDRRKFAEEMLARLALGFGLRISRKISTSRRLDLDVICFSHEKIFRIDAVSPGRSFLTLYRGKQGRRNNATLFGIHHAKKREVALLRWPIFEPLFMTHPSQVRSTTQLTLSLTRFVGKRLLFVWF